MIEQGSLLVLSCAAIWFLSRKAKWRRWGFVVGLMAQPFWFYSAWKAQQVGVLLLSCWYSYCYLTGVVNFFLKEKSHSTYR